MPNPTKRCTKCGKTKARSEFYRDASRKDGLGNLCKRCGKARGIAYRANNPEKTQARNAAYRANNLEKLQAIEATYRANHREKLQARAAAYYANNRETVRARKAAYRAKNPEKVRARHAAYRANNLEKIRAKTATREARKRGLISDFTATQWQILVELYDGNCAYCGKPSDKLQQEHVMPVVQDGGYTLSNIVPSCPTCNYSKGAKTPEQAGMAFKPHQWLEVRANA